MKYLASGSFKSQSIILFSSLEVTNFWLFNWIIEFIGFVCPFNTHLILISFPTSKIEILPFPSPIATVPSANSLMHQIPVSTSIFVNFFFVSKSNKHKLFSEPIKTFPVFNCNTAVISLSLYNSKSNFFSFKSQI